MQIIVRLLAVLISVLCVISPGLRSGPAVVRFGIVTDIHYAERDPAGTRFYRESAGKLAEFVSAMNREKPDFIVELGDFKDQDAQPDRTRTLTFTAKVESILAGFRGRRFHVLGNHDMDSLSKSEFLRKAVNSGIRRDRSYYSMDVKGIHFIILDANYRSDGMVYDSGNYDWTDANIPAAELEWLNKDLASGRSPAIVLVHQQLDGEGSYYVKNAPAVRRMIEASGRVLAVFQGHRHEGAYSRAGGIHYYTLKGLIEGSGPENNAYALVTVDPDRTIRITGYRKVVSAVHPKASGF
jgi:predicted phosphodiesterase